MKYVVKLQQENVYPKVEADPDNQRPDKWSSTVLANMVPFGCICPY